MSEHESLKSASESRREILKKFGRYTAAATPAMLMLLDSNRQEAMAKSRRRGKGKGKGKKGGHDYTSKPTGGGHHGGGHGGGGWGGWGGWGGRR